MSENIGFEIKNEPSSSWKQGLERLVLLLNRIKGKESMSRENRVREAIHAQQSNFLSSLGDLKMEIMKDNAKDLISRGQWNRFQPLETQVATPEMCGYSATVITENLKATYGQEVARTVYGHFDRHDNPYHYWTELSLASKKYFICATYGQFDHAYENTIIFTNMKFISKYKLKESSGKTESDRMTLKTLKENRGNLPLEKELNPNLRETYKRLKTSLVI